MLHHDIEANRKDPKTKICSYEIHDAQRLKFWSSVSGVLSALTFIASTVDAKSPAEVAIKGGLSLAVFTTLMIMGLRAEDRDAKAARAYGRDNVFNGFRQMLPDNNATNTKNSFFRP